MKILLVSDSHGYDDELKKVLENVKCDLKIHCGDSCFDKNSPFIKEFAAIVDGNHDQGFFPLTTTLPTALGNILITHGHRFNVYAGYDYLVDYMNKADIHICFHGHTHVPHYEIYKNMNLNKSENANFFFIESKKMQVKVNFKEHRYLRGIKEWLDGLLSDFGTNMLKMIIQVVIIVIGVFPSIFMWLNSHLAYQNAVICSINNFLGIEHISSINKKLYFAGVAETLYSYFILVVISTYVINRVVKDMS